MSALQVADVPPSTARPGAELQMRRRALMVFFAAQGFLAAAWASRVAVVQSTLRLTDGQLALALLGPGIGSILAMMGAAAMARRWRPAPVTLGFLMLYAGSAALVGIATSQITLFCALALWGAGLGAVDVLMNDQAAALEVVYGRSILPGFHAMFNLGALSGAGVAVALIAIGVSTLAALSSAGAVTFAVSVATLSTFRTTAHRDERPQRWRPTPKVLLLAGLAFAVFLCEGSAGNWSSSYLTSALHASRALAGSGYFAFAIGMTIGRVCGATLFGRYGVTAVLRVHTVAAGTLFGSMLLINASWAGIAGFAVLGWGMSVVFPAIVTRAGATVDLPFVVTAGYFGMLSGPALIGYVATVSSLRVGLLTIAGIVLLLTLSASFVGSTSETPRGASTGKLSD